MKRIKHHNQVKFIPATQSWLQIQKSIRIIHHSNRQKKKTKKKHIIIFTHARKALNKSNSR